MSTTTQTKEALVQAQEKLLALESALPETPNAAELAAWRKAKEAAGLAELLHERALVAESVADAEAKEAHRKALEAELGPIQKALSREGRTAAQKLMATNVAKARDLLIDALLQFHSEHHAAQTLSNRRDAIHRELGRERFLDWSDHGHVGIEVLPPSRHEPSTPYQRGSFSEVERLVVEIVCKNQLPLHEQPKTADFVGLVEAQKAFGAAEQEARQAAELQRIGFRQQPQDDRVGRGGGL